MEFLYTILVRKNKTINLFIKLCCNTYRDCIINFKGINK